MAQMVGGATVIDSARLIDYEFVLAPDAGDFFVSLNGGCVPSACTGFSVDGEWRFVLRQLDATFVTLPIPGEFHPLVEMSDDILFVQFVGGAVADRAVLPRVG